MVVIVEIEAVGHDPCCAVPKSEKPKSRNERQNEIFDDQPPPVSFGILYALPLPIISDFSYACVYRGDTYA